MKSSASVGELPSFPPSPYCVGDTKDSASMQAVGVANIMMRYCSDSKGVLNKDKLSGLLGMTVKYIAENAGVELPSIVSGGPAQNSASNNLTNPDRWKWNNWESRLFSTEGFGLNVLLHVRYRKLIFDILSPYIGADESKIRTLFQHPLFEESLRAGNLKTDITSLDFRDILQKHQGASTSIILDELFTICEGGVEKFLQLKPTGLIKSAIALGYLPEEGINKIFNLTA
ncbi:hypothetical protein [Endozoicomonas acroporae]|uniref:hypothetical protein n=1 Tax=Endozoicomonas acroporae TaxID=1701104 RepID=UPI0013D17075|nr:hypothetical protein [Endozoicomonas acroporae]